MHLPLILAAVALVASAISAMIGMGGGVLMLAVMFSLLPHAQAVPLHGAVQVIGHATRVLAYLRHVDWPTCGRFMAGAIPGLLLSIALVLAVRQLARSEPYLKMLVGAYIVVAAYLPERKRERESGRWDWPLMGLAAGVASLIVGAVGPMIGPLFVRRDFLKERLIATKAVCTLSLHALKVPAFWLIGTAATAESGAEPALDWRTFGWLAVVMGLATIAGTFLGKRMLGLVSERLFIGVFKAALTIAGLKILIWDGLLRLA